MTSKKSTGVAPPVRLPLAGGALIALALVLQGCQPSATATPAPEAIGLWDAYQQACQALQGETEQAQLVSASTQWQSVTPLALLQGTARWSFVFFSEADGLVFDLVVDAASAQLVSRTRVWAAPAVMAEGEWANGPGDALLAFLFNGGQAFLEEHPDAVVDFHLGLSQAGEPTWSMVALDTSDRSVLVLSMDVETKRVASTGQ